MWHARASALPTLAAPEHGVLGARTICDTIDETLDAIVKPGLRSLDLC
jgi:hypothetical protein